MTPGTMERVDSFWRGVFGDGPVGGVGRQVIVTHREMLAGYAGIYCVLRRGAVLISAPERLVATVRGWRPSAETVMDVRWWTGRLPGWSVLGPSVHSFLDRTDLLPAADGSAVRVAGPEDLHSLRDRVPSAEWRESGFADGDVARAWAVADQQNRVLAAANLTPFWGVPADIGVLTDGAARGRGLATAVAAVAVRHAIEEAGIARWRALESNAPSHRIAEKFGFEDDCVQLAVRPAPSTAV